MKVIGFCTWSLSILLLALPSTASSVVQGHLRARQDVPVSSWKVIQSNLCAMYDGRAALVGDQIFFMGGNYSFVESPASLPQPYLFALNLNTTLAVNGLIDSGSLWSTAVPSDAPYQYDGGVFFYDNTTLYLYAGLGNANSTASSQLWAYNVEESHWKQVNVNGGAFQVGDRLSGEHESIPATGLSFFSGGTDSDITGILRFDSSNPASLSWTNITAPSFKSLGSPGPQRSGAEMAYVPFGKQGVLIYIGGYNTTAPGTEYSDGLFDDAPLSTVDVYDIDSNTWFNVQTSGDIPSNRGELCHWVSPAPDLSSYSITLYGGWSLFNGTAYEDVYVLSIPSFKWIKITDGNNVEASQGSGIGRTRQRCVTWRNDHGFVIGGYVKNGTDQLNLQSCNPLFPPIRLLNLTTYVWQSTYDPANNASFEIHSAVSNVIGGGPSGGATLTAPKGGWTDTRLESIFGAQLLLPAAPTNLFATASPTTSSTQSEAASSSSSIPSSPSSSSTGAIIGGVVGGIAGVALGAAAMYFCAYRRNKRKQAEAAVGEKPPQDAYWQEMEDEGRRIHEADAGQFVMRPELGVEGGRAELDAGWSGSEMQTGR